MSHATRMKVCMLWMLIEVMSFLRKPKDSNTCSKYMFAIQIKLNCHDSLMRIRINTKSIVMVCRNTEGDYWQSHLFYHKCIYWYIFIPPPRKVKIKSVTHLELETYTHVCDAAIQLYIWNVKWLLWRWITNCETISNSLIPDVFFIIIAKH